MRRMRTFIVGYIVSYGEPNGEEGRSRGGRNALSRILIYRGRNRRAAASASIGTRFPVSEVSPSYVLLVNTKVLPPLQWLKSPD